MNKTTAIFFAALIALTLYCWSQAPAATRHHRKPIAHHAHLIKTDRAIDVHVAVPARLMAPKPPANHHRKKR